MLITGVQQANASLTYPPAAQACTQTGIVQSSTCWGGKWHGWGSKWHGWCHRYAELHAAALPAHDTDMHVQSAYVLGIHCNATSLTLC